MPETETASPDRLSRIRGPIVRGRWWILLTAPVVTLATIGVLYHVPNRYMSEATLVVVPQQVPTRYVTPTSETNIADALEAMTQDVLSRARLIGLIDEFGLYAEERRRLAPEEVVDLMRHHITIAPIDPMAGRREINSFKISFVAQQAALAQQVTSKLTSFFIQANLKAREDQATNTTNFLQAQLEGAKAKLTEREEQMRDFKAQFLGELPEQQQGNLAILNGAQLQLQNIQAGMDRAQQQRVYLESMINGYQQLSARGAPIPGTGASGGPSRSLTPLQSAQNDLSQLQLARSKLLITYSPAHYEVKVLDRQIAAEQAVVEKLKASEPAHSNDLREPATNGQSAREPSPEDSSIAQLRSQLEANRLEIRNIQEDEEKQKALIADYQKRLNLTPLREQQLAGIQRDYDLSKQEYTDLESKEQQSRLATNLEKQQGGQQFRLVEPPSLPELPSSPQRVRISLMGLGGGLFLGLVLAFARELARPTFHSTVEVTQRLGAPLVIGLPVILTTSDKRRLIWRKALEVLAGSVVATAICVAEVYVLRHP